MLGELPLCKCGPSWDAVIEDRASFDDIAPSAILGKILARRVTETDLGAMKRLKFSGISAEDFQKLQADFADTEKISAV